MNVNAVRPLFGLLAASFAMSLPRVNAETITLSFEATVTSMLRPWTANEHIPPIPFVVELGDVIRGTIEFDPAVPMTGLDNAIQPFALAIAGDGWSLETTRFTGAVLDDRRYVGTDCDCGWTGPVSQDPTVFLSDRFADPSLPPLDDRIELTRYLGHGEESETRVSHASDWQWQPALTLIGSTDILQHDDLLPASADVWNAFSTKELRIGVVGPYYDHAPGYEEWQIVRTESLIAVATISSFTVVPEPSWALYAAIALAWCLCARFPHPKMKPHASSV